MIRRIAEPLSTSRSGGSEEKPSAERREIVPNVLRGLNLRVTGKGERHTPVITKAKFFSYT